MFSCDRSDKQEKRSLTHNNIIGWNWFYTDTRILKRFLNLSSADHACIKNIPICPDYLLIIQPVDMKPSLDHRICWGDLHFWDAIATVVVETLTKATVDMYTATTFQFGHGMCELCLSWTWIWVFSDHSMPRSPHVIYQECDVNKRGRS